MPKPRPSVPPFRHFFTRAAGVTVRNDDRTDRQRLLGRLKPGEPIALVRDPENRRAPDVIALHRHGGGMLGDIPSETAEGMAPQMDRGVMFHGFVAEVTGGTRAKPTRGANLLIVLDREALGPGPASEYESMSSSTSTVSGREATELDFVEKLVSFPAPGIFSVRRHGSGSRCRHGPGGSLSLVARTDATKRTEGPDAPATNSRATYL